MSRGVHDLSMESMAKYFEGYASSWTNLVFLHRKVKKGSLLIDSSTIDPVVSKEMAKAAEKTGALFMDAPVSGGMLA